MDKKISVKNTHQEGENLGTMTLEQFLEMIEPELQSPVIKIPCCACKNEFLSGELYIMRREYISNKKNDDYEIQICSKCKEIINEKT
jgi:hypothetical protein